MAQSVRLIRPYTDRVSEPEKIAAPRAEASEHSPYTQRRKRPSAVSGRKPEIAGIEHLWVLQGSDEQHRLRVAAAWSDESPLSHGSERALRTALSTNGLPARPWSADLEVLA